MNFQHRFTGWHEYHCTDCDSVTDYDNLDELSQHKVNVFRQRKKVLTRLMFIGAPLVKLFSGRTATLVGSPMCRAVLVWPCQLSCRAVVVGESVMV